MKSKRQDRRVDSVKRKKKERKKENAKTSTAKMHLSTTKDKAILRGTKENKHH